MTWAKIIKRKDNNMQLYSLGPFGVDVADHRLNKTMAVHANQPKTHLTQLCRMQVTLVPLSLVNSYEYPAESISHQPKPIIVTSSTSHSGTPDSPSSIMSHPIRSVPPSAPHTHLPNWSPRMMWHAETAKTCICSFLAIKDCNIVPLYIKLQV